MRTSYPLHGRRLAAVVALLVACDGKTDDTDGDTDSTAPLPDTAHTDVESDVPVDSDESIDSEEQTDSDQPNDSDEPTDSGPEHDDSDTDPYDLYLLEACATPTSWIPSDTDVDYFGEPLGLGLAIACILLPTEEACPDPTTVTGIFDDCEFQEMVCVTGFSGRYDDAIFTGWHTDTPDSDDDAMFDSCCYEYIGQVTTTVCGRPWLPAGKPTTAPILPGHGWSSAAPAVSTSHPAALHRWIHDAAAEHASIAAFAALTLDLLAHGFPAHLLQLTARAQAEEVHHARGALQIASRLAGQPLAPGPLPVAHTHASLIQLAVDTAVQGGLGESLAAAIAAARLAVCTDPFTRRHLARVVEDESRHASLAWEIVEQAILIGGDEVADAVQIALAEAVEQTAYTPVPHEPIAPEHGLCGHVALTRARDAVLCGVFGWRAAA